MRTEAYFRSKQKKVLDKQYTKRVKNLEFDEIDKT